MSLLFSRASDVAIAAPLLAGLSGATVLSAFTAVTSAILQGAGCTNVPMAATAIGGLAKLASNYFLIGNRNINIRGAPIGTTVCYLIVFLINITSIAKIRRSKYRIIFKPAVCALRFRRVLDTYRHDKVSFARGANCSKPACRGRAGALLGFYDNRKTGSIPFYPG